MRLLLFRLLCMGFALTVMVACGDDDDSGHDTAPADDAGSDVTSGDATDGDVTEDAGPGDVTVPDAVEDTAVEDTAVEDTAVEDTAVEDTAVEDVSEDAVAQTLCEVYCETQETNCTGDNAIEFAVDCATDCAGWTEGEDGDTDVNTTHCRLYHAGAAADDAALHCPHASPDGGGVCVDAVVAGPTWDGEVKAILDANCGGCHVGGNSGQWNTGSYASTQNDSYYCAGLTKGECIVERIIDGSMPTSGSVLSSMTDSGELATLQAWIDGGMPEN